MSEEVWVPIEGWDFYEISSSGRVRSVDRVVHHRFGTQLKRGQILKPTSRNGGEKITRPFVNLHANGVSRQVRPQLLLAQHFPEAT